jgi:hypothetical protein
MSRVAARLFPLVLQSCAYASLIENIVPDGCLLLARKERFCETDMCTKIWIGTRFVVRRVSCALLAPTVLSASFV